MANLIETRDGVVKALEKLYKPGLTERGVEKVNAEAITLALLYIGDQLEYLNKTLDNIEQNTNRIV